MDNLPLLLNSITEADATSRGRVVISGSHGGLYPAAIASREGIHAVIFNDAGIGFEQAGISGIQALESCGMAGAAVDCLSSEIGSADDIRENGIISFANSFALAAKVRVGMGAQEAAAHMARASAPHAELARPAEARWDHDLTPGSAAVLCVDSASLVQVTDAGRIIVTGSHGGLIGGDPRRGLKAHARLAIFNDAGTGKNNAGTRRLSALENQGIAAATVSHATCRIGDAASALSHGVISTINPSARAMGIRLQSRLADFLKTVG